MDRETLVNIVYSGKVRFIPVRRCSLCDEYIGYKFVKMCDGSIIPVFSSGCGCCGVNNGQLFERTWDELLDIINNQNKPMDKRTEADELILNEGILGYKCTGPRFYNRWNYPYSPIRKCPSEGYF